MDNFENFESVALAQIALPNFDKCSTLSWCVAMFAESSEPIPIDTEDTSNETEKNVTFADDIAQNSLLYAVPFRDETYERQTQTGDELIDFFKRPIEIYSFTWDVGVDYTNTAIFPWQLYMTNQSVLNKLDSFKLIHGTLHIKIIVNGTPFHYGRLLVGVYPSQYTNNTSNLLPDTTVTVTNYRNELAAGVMTYQANRALFSSRPHVFVNPGKNDPAMIHWPFFAATDWVDVISQLDWRRLGQLEIWQLNQLRHSNGGATEVRVSFIAWMDDVEVAGITPALPGQSSKPKRTKSSKKSSSSSPTKVSGRKSEFGQNGAISAPASALASAAGYLVDIPVIGKFAKATQIGANAVSSIASIFGFSKPTVLDGHNFVVANYMGDLAVTSGSDPVIKLSVDPKQELTIDPSTVGLSGCDEMAFLEIAKREALIHSFEWVVDPSIAGNPFGHIWAARVHPMTHPIFLDRHCLTPVGFIAHPFTYWTGSLRYRIQIVCSQNHSGRLLIAYNPDSTGAVGTGTDLNRRFSHILDISQETDVTFEINWSQPEAFREVHLDYSNNDSVILGPISVMTGNDNFRTNGRLDIYVLNRLTSPVPSNAFINVFVSAGDSFKVNAPYRIGFDSWSPSGGNFPIPPLEAESSAITRIALTEEEDAPAQNTHYVLNGDYDDGANAINEVYFGESIVSIRNMLKRYCFHSILPFKQIGGDHIFRSQSVRMIFPSGRQGGLYGSSPLTTGSFGPLMTYLRYYAQGYIGFRGGIRWKSIGVLNNNFNWKYFETRRVPIQNIQGDSNDVIATNADTVVNFFSNYMDTGDNTFSSMGTAVTASHLMGGVVVEYPFQAPLRYAEIHETPNTDLHYRGMYHTMLCSLIGSMPSGVTETNIPIEKYCAGAEDAAFFFFVGVPPLSMTLRP